MKTIVVIGSGPSLTEADCNAVHASGFETIVVNTSWRLAPFASVLYAGDACWWEAYGKEAVITAERWTSSRQAALKYGIKHHKAPGASNSGARAIMLAFERGADRVLLLGFDCSVAGGTHWHGNHDKTGNPDAARCRQWVRDFAVLAKKHPGKIINCSRETALTCFPRVYLEEALSDQRDKSYAASLREALKDPEEATAYAEALRELEMTKPAEAGLSPQEQTGRSRGVSSNFHIRP